MFEFREDTAVTVMAYQLSMLCDVTVINYGWLWLTVIQYIVCDHKPVDKCTTSDWHCVNIR